MVDIFMERGFTYFDTAHRYNDEASEPAIREALVKRYPRESYVLTNKITLNYIKNSEEQESFLKKQLDICGVDYFDNYLIHNMGAIWYPIAEKFETFNFIKKMKANGYIHHIGFSFHGTADILEAILQAHQEIEIVQLQINYLDWEDESIQSRKCYEVARKYGKQIVVMEPVKGGTLVNLPEEAATFLLAAVAGRKRLSKSIFREMKDDKAVQSSLASWAIRYAAGLEGVITTLSGMSTLEQVDDNTHYMQDFRPLTQHEQSLLKQVSSVIHSKTSIACTNCRYCTTECPQNIAIPDYFNLYNNMKRLKNTSYLANQVVYYANLAQINGKASDCIGCGLCEKNCPQSLHIRELLQKVADEME